MKVEHRQGSYEIEFCSLDAALSRLPSDHVIVTDDNVADHYGSLVGGRYVVAPAGEESKSVSEWARILSELVRAGANRRTTVVAFGGGVVGDLAGFVAASYMRGVPCIQIPTTLLAQVDSSVGGKVGIDLPEGKNLAGAFHPPTHVFLCLETLNTLPQRHLLNGMAEVWKYGFILDASLVAELRRDASPREEIVRRCIDLKRQVVEADEFETRGERAKLNFGHTVGHAIETMSGYGPVLHGEAISIGMVVEARLSEHIGLAPTGTADEVEECLRSQGLPTASIWLENVDMLITAMRHDKKAGEGRLAFALLTGIGSARLIENVPETDVRAVLAR